MTHGNTGNQHRLGKFKKEIQSPLPARCFPSELQRWKKAAKMREAKSFSSWVRATLNAEIENSET